MRLREVSVTNFRNFDNFTVQLEDFSFIIGANNVGKTNFLKALELVFSSSNTRYALVGKQDFLDPAKPVTVEVVFEELQAEDKAAFFHDEGLINPTTNTITIRFESAWSSDEQDVWNECYFIRDDLPESEQRVIDFFPKFKQLVPLFTIPSSRSAAQEIGLSRNRDFGRIVRLFADDYLKPIETLRQDVVNELSLLEEEQTHWGRSPQPQIQAIAEATASLLSVIQSDFAEQIADRGSDEVMDELDEVHGECQSARLALGETRENEAEMVAACKQASQLLDKADTLTNRCRAQLILYDLRDSMLRDHRFEQLNGEWDTIFSEILPERDLALSLFPIQDDDLISQVSVNIDGFPVLEHGSGYQSMFVVGLKLMRTLSQLALTEGLDVRNFILAVEEPEVHLHPHMQRHLINSLHRLQDVWASKGYRLQIIVTTHSPSIVGRAEPHQLLSFRRERGKTRAVKWTRDELQDIAEELETDEAKLGKRYNQLRNWTEFFQDRYADVFFSNCVIVVEGQTEEGAVPVWANKLEPPVDFDRLGISLVNAEGDSITYTLKILDRFGIDHICLADRGDDHYVEGVSSGGLILTAGDEIEEDIIASVSLTSVIRALELVSNETSNANRLGWIKGNIGGCKEVGDIDDLLQILGSDSLEQSQLDKLKREALRWIKKSKVKSLTFGRTLAQVTPGDETPETCRRLIIDAAERALRKIEAANG